MNVRMNHPAARAAVCICDGTPSADPTRTANFRLRYRAMLDARWRQLSVAMRKVVVDQDFFGLQSLPVKGIALTMAILVPRDQRIGAFRAWLDQIMSRTVMTDGGALQPMIANPYMEGVSRAAVLTNSRINIGQSNRTTVGNIQQLAESELQGIADTVAQHLTRRAEDGIDIGLDANQLMHHLDDGIRVYGDNRTNIMVNYYVVRAYNLGTLDQYEVAGIKQVRSVPETAMPFRVNDAERRGPGSRLRKGEQPSASTLRRIRRAQSRIERLKRVDVITAGDDDVCTVCEDIAEDGPYPINTARRLIPAHPHCRCAFVPAEDERFADE